MPKPRGANIPQVQNPGGFQPPTAQPQAAFNRSAFPGSPQGRPFQPITPENRPWPPPQMQVPSPGPMAPATPPQGQPGMVPPMTPGDTLSGGGGQQFNPFPNVPTQSQGMLSSLGQQRGYSPEKLQRLFTLMNNMNAGAQGGR